MRRIISIPAAAAAIGLMLALLVIPPASGSGNPFQRGPDPTPAYVASSNGGFATAQLTVPPGNGFNGGGASFSPATRPRPRGAAARGARPPPRTAHPGPGRGPGPAAPAVFVVRRGRH